MAKLDLWKDPWPLDVAQCPCDVHFMAWLAQRGGGARPIFHFGTGAHHHVGLNASAMGHAILGITANEAEYAQYMKLVVEHPTLGQNYRVEFGDIYQTNPQLLPQFDIITLFHLCEFWFESNAPFARVNDDGLLDVLTEKLNPGGQMLFYTGSYAYDATAKLLPAWAKRHDMIERAQYESLRVFEKP
jgi:hypothetical protein